MNIKRYKTRISRYVGALPIFVIGAVAAINIGWQMTKNWAALQPFGSDPVKYIPIATLLISLIATAFGFDRLFLSKDLEDRLDASTEATKELLKRSISARHLDGADQIYASRAYLWSKMQVRARTILVGGPKAPDILIEAITRRLTERRNSNKEVRFEVALIIDPNNVNLQKIKEQHDLRFSIFKKNRVERYVEVKIVESNKPLNFDVLIIDEQHINIGFPTFCNTDTIMSGLVFEDQTTIARNLANWFDSCVYPKGILFDDWFIKQTNKSEKKAIS